MAIQAFTLLGFDSKMEQEGIVCRLAQPTDIQWLLDASNAKWGEVDDATSGARFCSRYGWKWTEAAMAGAVAAEQVLIATKGNST